MSIDWMTTERPLAKAPRRRLAAMGIAQLLIETRFGEILLVRSEQGLSGLWFTGQKHHPGLLDIPHDSDDPLLQRSADQLIRYFAGNAPSTGFDVPLDLQGTPFQREVWHALLKIAPGATLSYGEIAEQVGASRAVRAVGSAVARNPISVIVPCHRVIGRDGSMTGYAGGLQRKRALLALEQDSTGKTLFS